MFVVEDELHAEIQGQFRSREEAIVELRRLASIPWDEEPNRAPCTNWRNCGRDYELLEYDDTSRPWRKLSRILVLKISAEGVEWVGED